MRHEEAEVIGQEVLPLGDGLQRGTRVNKNRPVPEGSEPSPSREAADAPERHDSSGSVPIEVLPIPNRGGRHAKEELYPFGSIEVATCVDGQLKGQSFFIPDVEHPKRHLAVARKRYRGERTFWARPWPGGMRVWRKS